MTKTIGTGDFVQTKNVYLIALVPKPSALLSLMGSYCVVREIVFDIFDAKRRGIRTKPISRVLLCMSSCDLFVSLGFFLSTWPAPKQLDYIWGNVGSQGFCTFQGFIFQFGYVATMMWSGTLAIFYLLILRYGWSDTKLAKIEKWFHLVNWTFVAGAAIFPLPLEMYNNTEGICWIEAYPYGCTTDCVRGINAWIYQLTFKLFPGWACFFLVVGIMAAIYRKVRQLENTNLKYASSVLVNASTSERGSGDLRKAEWKNRVNRAKSQAVAKQAIYYMFAIWLPYTLDFCSDIQLIITGKANPILSYFAWLCLPLQGFLNFLVFVRNRCGDDIKTPECRLLRWLLFESFCCCFSKIKGCGTNISSPSRNDHHREKAPSSISETPPTAACSSELIGSSKMFEAAHRWWKNNNWSGSLRSATVSSKGRGEERSYRIYAADVGTDERHSKLP